MRGWCRRAQGCIEPRSSARKLVVAALVREGPLRLAVEQTSAVDDISPRRRYGDGSPCIELDPPRQVFYSTERGVAPEARRFSERSEREINAAIDAIFLTQPRGTYQAVCEETWRRCDAARLRRPSRNAIVRRLKARTRSRSRRERTRAGPPRRDSEALRRLATYRVVALALRLDAGRSRSSRQSMNAPSAACG